MWVSVSEYLELASLQNTQTGGPRGFSDVIGVWKERTEKFAEFVFSQVSKRHRPLILPMLPCWSGGQVGPPLYEKVEILQIIILCIYIGICCYLCTCGTISLQTFFPCKFRQFLSARVLAMASGGYNRAETGHWQKITFQKYVHPKFWGIDLNFGMYMHIDVMDNMS